MNQFINPVLVVVSDKGNMQLHQLLFWWLTLLCLGCLNSKQHKRRNLISQIRREQQSKQEKHKQEGRLQRDGCSAPQNTHHDIFCCRRYSNTHTAAVTSQFLFVFVLSGTNHSISPPWACVSGCVLMKPSLDCFVSIPSLLCVRAVLWMSGLERCCWQLEEKDLLCVSTWLLFIYATCCRQTGARGVGMMPALLSFLLLNTGLQSAA